MEDWTEKEYEEAQNYLCSLLADEQYYEEIEDEYYKDLYEDWLWYCKARSLGYE